MEDFAHAFRTDKEIDLVKAQTRLEAEKSRNEAEKTRNEAEKASAMDSERALLAQKDATKVLEALLELKNELSRASDTQDPIVHHTSVQSQDDQ